MSHCELAVLCAGTGTLVLCKVASTLNPGPNAGLNSLFFLFFGGVLGWGGVLGFLSQGFSVQPWLS